MSERKQLELNPLGTGIAIIATFLLGFIGHIMVVDALNDYGSRLTALEARAASGTQEPLDPAKEDK